MRLHVLGTANGNYHKDCYQTCFCIEHNDKYFLVDGGAGNQILGRLATARIALTSIHDIFISHKHPDHILGVVWVLKKICGAIRKGNYVGDCRVYANCETIHAIQTIRDLVFDQKNILPQIQFITINDGDEYDICDLHVQFFDTHARKATQHGFIINQNQIVFCGDEPLATDNFARCQNCQWLLHDAFCLDHEDTQYQVAKIAHSTVGQAARTAQTIHAQNLILWHTATDNLATRQTIFTQNAQQFFDGKIWVPNDGDIINLSVSPAENFNDLEN